MSDTDPRSRRVVVPGVRWLRFPRRLETEYRDYQCREAVEGFRVNAFYILLLYVLLQPQAASVEVPDLAQAGPLGNPDGS